jgi:predicted RNA-binding protein with EMAP domain
MKDAFNLDRENSINRKKMLSLIKEIKPLYHELKEIYHPIENLNDKFKFEKILQ